MNQYKIQIIAVLIIIAASLTGAWYLWGPKPPVQQLPASEIRHANGALTLAKAPDTESKPSMPLQKGERLQRRIIVTVKAKSPVSEVSGSVTVETKAADMAKPEITTPGEAQPPECPPVTVNLDLVKQTDGQQRVNVSSPDGEILGGMDIPVENAVVESPKVWAVGAVYQPLRETWGIAVERDFGWIRAGVDLIQRDSGKFPTEPLGRVLFRF